jgi:UDPglucose 6-dehydrogenase
MKIEIVGYGWVGKAMEKLFGDKHDINITDPLYPGAEVKFEGNPDVAFICVPTPVVDGKLNCAYVEKAVRDSAASLVIIRSTVMPGTTQRLVEDTGKNVVFWPEYLGETVAHPMTDQKGRDFVVIGGTKEALRMAVELLTTVYNASVRIRQMDSTSSEVVKLSENRAIAFKVAQCQELYDACEGAGVDYYEIREAVYGDDPRFNLWWTMVYPEARGFNSKCIPKDVYGWASWAETCGMKPELTRALLTYNDKLIK